MHPCCMLHVEAEGVLVVSFTSQTQPTPADCFQYHTCVCDTESDLHLKQLSQSSFSSKSG